MNYIFEALKYVTSDPFFWFSMSITTCIGIFIGAVLYDGLLTEVKKGIVVIGSYAILLSMTNAGRILPIIYSESVHDVRQPFAGIVTLLLVTTFYIFGMLLGVKITNHAHKGRHA